jgi:hypothetical protein
MVGSRRDPTPARNACRLKSLVPKGVFLRLALTRDREEDFFLLYDPDIKKVVCPISW